MAHPGTPNADTCAPSPSTRVTEAERRLRMFLTGAMLPGQGFIFTEHGAQEHAADVRTILAALAKSEGRS